MKKYPDRLYITKNQLRKYGKILVKNPKNIKALYKVNRWRASHAYPMHIIFIAIKNKATRIDKNKNFIVAQRIKRLPTIINKLERHKGMRLDTMQDIGGVRVIFKNPKILHKFMANTKLGEHRLIKTNDYITNPKQDGYRGIHLVYEYTNHNKSSQYNGLKIEVQVRTQLQHEWATAVEALGISTHQHLKLGSGNEKWRLFFELSSTVLAFTEYPENTRKTSSNDLETTLNKLSIIVLIS